MTKKQSTNGLLFCPIVIIFFCNLLAAFLSAFYGDEFFLNKNNTEPSLPFLLNKDALEVGLFFSRLGLGIGITSSILSLFFFLQIKTTKTLKIIFCCLLLFSIGITFFCVGQSIKLEYFESYEGY